MNSSAEWQPLEPGQLTSLFDESKKFMEDYLKKIQYDVIDASESFKMGDLVCYKSFMWGNVPGVVCSLSDDRVACHLIGYPDRQSAWQRIDNVRHIRLKQSIG